LRQDYRNREMFCVVECAFNRVFSSDLGFFFCPSLGSSAAALGKPESLPAMRRHFIGRKRRGKTVSPQEISASEVEPGDVTLTERAPRLSPSFAITPSRKRQPAPHKAGEFLFRLRPPPGGNP
jgi:hypothetical protein